MRARRGTWTAGVVATALGLASSARADDKADCIAASEEAQQLRIDGKLTAARKRLVACARTECPAIVKQDCARWMTEVEAAQPTVVLGARDASGRDLIAVRVLEDGVVVADHLDGRPLPVDPGPHVFRFEAPPAAPAELQVLARAGEQNRAITATLAAAAPTRSAPPATEPPASAPADARPPPSPLAWVFGGVALASLGTALAFEIAQVSDYDHLSSTCAGHCPSDQVDHVGTERWIAGIAAGVGVASLAASVYFFVARPNPAPKAPPIALDVAPVRAGAAGTLTLRF